MRHIPLEGASNFRDFGGYDTAGGRRVKMGRLYRSDRLSMLTEADFKALESRHIRLICDLRREREIEMNPTNWPEPTAPERLHISLLTEVSGPDVMARVLADPEIRRDAVRTRLEMIALYGRLARETPAIEGYKLLFERLARADAYPFLVHCSAGKDRTGVVCAMIQAILGVSEADVREDFMLTAKHYDGARNIEARVPQIMAGLDVEGWTIEALAPVFTVEEAYLEGFLEAVSLEHGTIERFLTGRVGVPEATLEEIRELLLE
jgi:protein-tyrosine phosphatase